MEIVSTVASAAHSAAEAIEHPFNTISARLTQAWHGLESFFGHPYCAPPLQDALTTLHGVVVDLTQEVAELRVPCPCKPAPTSTASSASTTADTDDAGQASGGAASGAAAIAAASEPAPPAPPSGDFEVVSAADAADFRAWKAAKAAAASFTGQA